MTAPTIALSMIVKNEAHVIARCLRSVRPHITSWCIVDTGSTDDTIEVIRRELEGIPGTLKQSSWVDFSTNRNEALDIARTRGTDYLMVIDADEELLCEPGAFDLIDGPAYSCRFVLKNTEGVWLRKLLLKSSVPWRYQGAIHEYLHLDGVTSLVVPNVSVLSHHDSARNSVGEIVKYSRDAKTLKREIRKDPKNTRLWFYYAMSLAGAQKIDAAIEAYRKRASLGGWDEEVFYALLQIAALREFRGDHPHDVARAYLEAYNFRPTRAEPLWSLAVLHSNAGETALAELYARAACRIPRPADALLVFESIYAWRAADELVGALGKLGRLDEARRIVCKLLELEQVPEQEKPRMRENLATLEQALAA